jgi:hypothetical protein
MPKIVTPAERLMVVVRFLVSSQPQGGQKSSDFNR